MDEGQETLQAQPNESSTTTDTSNVETQTSETTTVTTPPTETPKPPVDLAAAQQAMLNVVAEANRRAAEAEQRARELEQRINAPPAKSPEELSKEYYDNPAEFIRRTITEQIENSVKPLNDWRQNFTKEQRYAQLKQQVGSQLEHFAGVEQYVDQIIASAPANIDITPQVIQQAYVNALGYAIANRLYVPGQQQPTTTTTTTPTNTPQPPNTVTPPHRTPTPPAPPAPPTKQRPTLTENERRLMREWGMSEAQWWEYMDMNATDVARGGK